MPGFLALIPFVQPGQSLLSDKLHHVPSQSETFIEMEWKERKRRNDDKGEMIKGPGRERRDKETNQKEKQ